MLENEEADRRLREYIITQMLNWFRFLLAVNEIEDSKKMTFEYFCANERSAFLFKYDSPKYIPNYTCMWDIIFNLLGHDIPFTPIFSAYCRSNKIKTKHDLYIKMSAELDIWVNTINQFDDIVRFAIGMSKNCDIWHIFREYIRVYNKQAKHTTFYTNALDVLSKNNFENIELYLYKIIPYKPIQMMYDDIHQQTFFKFIISYLRHELRGYSFKCSTYRICEFLSRHISGYFGIDVQINHTDRNIMLNTFDQIIEYCKSKIPQYPAEIKDHLSILVSVEDAPIILENKLGMLKLAKMAELSHYNLRDLPIFPITLGHCGATPLDEIPLEQIPEYYARLTHNYSGKRTKAAKRDIQLNI